MASVPAARAATDDPPVGLDQPDAGATDRFNAAVAAITAAFGDPTRRDIYLFARATPGGVTAGEVAERFDLHPNVARHHLEKLAGGGYLDVGRSRSDGAAGRPSKRYVPGSSDDGLALRPRGDDLLAALLVRALDRLGPDAAEALADEIGFEYGRALADRMGPGETHRSVRSAVNAVVEALTAHGFAAHAEPRGTSLTIVSECCPFGSAAQANPTVVCAIDRGLIRGMLAGLYGETDPRIEASRPAGAPRCVARVSRAYLDHASTSPLRPAALDAMLPYLRDHHGDPGRLHAEGRAKRVAVEDAREQVAELFGARPREVVFTASGTEAVNTAIYGAVAGAEGVPASVVTTAVEHSAVLDACARAPVETLVVGVDRTGQIDPAELATTIRPDTALVSVQVANHEVGTLQPVVEVCVAAREHGTLVHLDACTANGHVALDFAGLDADLCSLSAHKLGGPKGVGALLVRRGLRLPPFVVGGAQERARRGGLENVPAIVGFGAAAAELAGGGLEREAAAACARTERLAAGACAVEGIERYGAPDARVPHLVCLGIAGVEAEPILLALDQHGVAVHSGSSCSSEMLEPSPVLEAMGVDADRSLRASVGWSSTDADVDAFLATFPDVVARLRSLRG